MPQHRKTPEGHSPAALPILRAISCFLLLAQSAPADPPNFVFFPADDLGYMDVAANNPETFYQPPNINRLAREGMRFTNAYAASPVCSPTRHSILTGKYASRVGATDGFSGNPRGRFHPAPLHDRMPLAEITQQLHAWYRSVGARFLQAEENGTQPWRPGR